MVILGLGSNLGDRFQHLRDALQAIRHINTLTVKRVSPVYLSDALLLPNSEKEWDRPYLNLALRIETSATPMELLGQMKAIEKNQGRQIGWKWGPRPIDIDILAWDTLQIYNEQLHIPHEHLHERPFALWPLADVAPEWIYPLANEHQGKTAWEIAERFGSRFDGKTLCRTQQIPQRIDTPEWMGVINITPDSFSDGGLHMHTEAVLHQAEKLVHAGASILDIGAEATNPSAAGISADEEWTRLELPLKALLNKISQFSLPPKA
jgi:2-amino-4-hydroxy-6-hydroxymethyldihydropteridine diphosphokinase/dihydropteroate synthase